MRAARASVLRPADRCSRPSASTGQAAVRACRRCQKTGQPRSLRIPAVAQARRLSARLRLSEKWLIARPASAGNRSDKAACVASATAEPLRNGMETSAEPRWDREKR